MAQGGGTRQGIIAEGPPRLKRGPKLQAMDVVRNQGGTSGKRVRAGANLQQLWASAAGYAAAGPGYGQLAWYMPECWSGGGRSLCSLD